MSDATGKSSHVAASHEAAASTTASTSSKNSTNEAQALASTMTFNSMGALKAKSPKFYNFLMQSIGMNICIQMKHQQDKLAEKWREMREQEKG